MKKFISNNFDTMKVIFADLHSQIVLKYLALFCPSGNLRKLLGKCENLNVWHKYIVGSKKIVTFPAH